MEGSFDQTNDYQCVHCGHPVRELYRDFKKGIIKISHCSKCGEVADKYIEYDSVIIFLDVLLLQRPVYRHILINSKFKGYWRFLLVLWLCDALTKLMQRKADEDHDDDSSSPRLQPDHVFYSALEWHFYQDYLLSAAESFLFFSVVVALLAGKHILTNKNLKHFEWEGVLRAVCVSSMGRLLVIPALIWGQSYSALGLTITHLFVAASIAQALPVVVPRTSLPQAAVVVLVGCVVQTAVVAMIGFSPSSTSLFLPSFAPTASPLLPPSSS